MEMAEDSYLTRLWSQIKQNYPSADGIGDGAELTCYTVIETEKEDNAMKKEEIIKAFLHDKRRVDFIRFNGNLYKVIGFITDPAVIIEPVNAKMIGQQVLDQQETHIISSPNFLGGLEAIYRAENVEAD